MLFRWNFDNIKENLVDATLENGCLYFIPGSYHSTTSENPGIGKNMDEVFKFYLQFFTSKSVALPMKAGSCSFHNGLTIQGAGTNMQSYEYYCRHCNGLTIQGAGTNMTNGFRNVLAYYESTFKNKPSWQLTFKEKSISIISSFSHKIILLGIESVTVC